MKRFMVFLVIGLLTVPGIVLANIASDVENPDVSLEQTVSNAKAEGLSDEEIYTQLQVAGVSNSAIAALDAFPAIAALAVPSSTDVSGVESQTGNQKSDNKTLADLGSPAAASAASAEQPDASGGIPDQDGTSP